MLALISPAKTFDFDTPAPTREASQPEFLAQAQELIDVLRPLAPHDISKLMGISDKLGVLNYDRFADWQPPFDLDNAKQALFAFKGDVYVGLAAETLQEGDWKFAQDHLRILSGLYGLLAPLDLIQPYRLEMGTRLANPRGKDLYEFWGPRITEAINAQLKRLADPVVVNLASNEYFKSVQKKDLEAPLITPVFKDWKTDRYKIISFYAKKARGMMSAYILKNRLTDAEGLKGFDEEGYRYNSELSTATEWVFTRDEA